MQVYADHDVVTSSESVLDRGAGRVDRERNGKDDGQLRAAQVCDLRSLEGSIKHWVTWCWPYVVNR